MSVIMFAVVGIVVGVGGNLSVPIVRGVIGSLVWVHLVRFSPLMYIVLVGDVSDAFHVVAK